MMQDNHIFQGMRRDNHPIRQEKQFLWDAHNIRLTTRDGNTMLSITNEKSTENIMSFGKGETYVGHTVIGDYLILLTTGLAKDRIYRITLGADFYVKEILYEGTDLNFDANCPAQMISDYESELVQKVYWVDGFNSPRVINVAKPELVYPSKDGAVNPEKTALYNSNGNYNTLYTDHPFGFVQDLELNENVTIERLQSSVGIFPSGVIQYAMTYLHKYGQESNIFYVSEPLYLSYSDRGGSPESRISTSFRIGIKNVDKKFQYVRVYSIIRTSINAVPTVKRVADIDISKVDVAKATANSERIFIVDNNTTGDIVDPTYLLYVGGKDISANCIASKDNTLFLGNISYKRKSIFDLDIRDMNKESENYLRLSPALTPSEVNRTIELPAQDTEYVYANQLSNNTLTFKRGETYRLGCRFQYKNGEWSEPVWVKDHIYNYNNISYDGSFLNLGKIVGEIPPTLKDTLINKGYKKVQALIALPSYKDRTIIAQGILCPTVGQVGNRVQDSGAWAQSSWLLRPWSAESEGDGYFGAIPACQHDQSLPFGNDRDVELQTMAIILDEKDSAGNVIGTAKQMGYEDMISGEGKEGAETFYGAFVVDQSIVTMHSPDIEFGDIINLLDSEVKLTLHKVGEVKFDKNKGEIDIQTETPVADPDASGFIKRSLSGDGERSLVSGLFYEDSMVDDSDNGQKIQRYKTPKLWMTYLWHRAGSLNNDCVRPENTGTRTSVLKKKSIVNFKISNSTLFSSDSVELPVNDIKVFNSNEVSLVKLKRKDRNNTIKSVSYYGNVDTLVPAYIPYSYMCTASSSAVLKNPNAEFNGQVFVKGEQKTFLGLKVTNAKGSNSFIQAGLGGPDGGSVSGSLPYIVEPDSTTTSEESRVVMVTITNKARLDLNISSGRFSGTVTLLENIIASDGTTVVPSQFSWSIKGETDYQPVVEKYSHTWLGTGSKHPRWFSVTPLFTSATTIIDSSNGEGGGIEGAENIGDNYEALKLSKDGVRLKYKSTPHAVISLDSPLAPLTTQGSLYLVELRQNILDELRYGGKTEEALKNNLWIPAGPARNISEGEIEWIWGDTWFQRYDCLKTYPFTFEDINQVTEVGSFYCETRVNIDGRYDRNRGSTSFSLSPINFNLINPVYSQLDTLFTSRMLDDDYYKVTDYHSQFLWTGVKTPTSDTDLWTNLHVASTYDMDGSNGRLTAIQAFNGLLLGFQDKAVSQILFNSRVQIQASDGVPIEIANNQKVEGIRIFSNSIGCQDKFSMISTPMGIYFMDNNNHALYKFDGQLNNIGLQLGTLYWARENYWDVTWRYPKQDTQYNGIRLSYDPKFQDIYFVPGADYDNREALCYSEQLGQFTSLMSYGGAVMFPHKGRFYSIAPDPTGLMTLWENFPLSSDSYNNIFGVVRDYGFSFISNDNPTITKIFDTIEMRADCYIPDRSRENNFGLIEDRSDSSVVNQLGKPFNLIRVDNEYQDTGEVTLNDATMRKKFRIWRALIPRKKGSRERVRNTWAKITLTMRNPNTIENNDIEKTKMTILHDLNVGYTI